MKTLEEKSVVQILAFCPKCKEEKLANGVSPARSVIFLSDAGTALFTCPHGHQAVAVTIHRKYELLFESGCLALLNGYPREAVTSFAAALERFFEFYIRVIALKRGALQEQLPEMWRDIAAQSERQLGAFLIAHLIETQTHCIIPEELRSVRNKVVHKGYIPTPDEAAHYGEQIWNLIMPMQEYLFSEAHEYVATVLDEEAERVQRRLEPSIPVQVHVHCIMFMESSPKFDRYGFSFRGRLKKLTEVAPDIRGTTGTSGRA